MIQREAQLRLPDTPKLTAALSTLLRSKGLPSGHLTVTEREPLILGTFPKEVVTCRLGNGQEMRFFCKYAAGLDTSAHGHRGGVAHEAQVYHRVLQPLKASAPALIGVYSDATSGEQWLILEYLEQAIRFSRSPEPDAAPMAAAWIGSFHTASQRLARTAVLPFLKSYDEAYYLGWAERVRRYHGHLHKSMPWLEKLCARFDKAVAVLMSVPPTVIHGEYYPENVLIRDRRIHPVDWESAAVATGEIDLASLTEGWPEEVVRECEAHYEAARWPQGTPDGLYRRLWAARLYMQFRWLGDPSQLDDSKWRLELLHSAGKRLGLI